MVPSDKLDDGVTENVLFEFEAEGTAAIKTQVLKSSEETSKVPERQLFTELTVIEDGTIASEKVTEIDEVTATDVSESDGEVDETVVEVVEVVVDSSLSSLQEMIVRLKQEMRIMYKTLFIFFLHQ